MYRLRGHHLLCVHGFKGMGYSPQFVDKMSQVVGDIRDDNKDFDIEVVADLDDTCQACPHQGQTTCEKSPSSNDHVLSLDHHVIHHLDLQPGDKYAKSELVQRVADKVDPEDLDHLCQGCSWLSYGVCKDGIRALKQRHL